MKYWITLAIFIGIILLIKGGNIDHPEQIGWNKKHIEPIKPDTIQQVFVINLPKRTDRWEQVKKAFEYTGLDLNRWEATDGKTLSPDYVRQVTSTFCNYFCSNSMIGIWLSHYKLWKHIAENNLTNVLILEDDAKPVENFNERFNKYWTNMPSNWDIIFLGCFQCDGSTSGKRDNINGNKHLFIPDFPAGMHGYMISNAGAKKLVRELKDVEYHIDIFLSSHVFNIPGKNVQMYGFKPYLIYQDTTSESDNQGHTHLLLTKLVQIAEKPCQLPWSTSMNSQIYNIRFYDIPITHLTLSIFALTVFINLIPFPQVRKYALAILIIYECCEVVFNRPNSTRTKTITFELIVIAVISAVMTVVRPFSQKYALKVMDKLSV